MRFECLNCCVCVFTVWKKQDSQVSLSLSSGVGAMSTALLLWQLSRVGSAPWLSSREHTSTLFLDAASCRGVNCHKSMAFTQAPCCGENNHSMILYMMKFYRRKFAWTYFKYSILFPTLFITKANCDLGGLNSPDTILAHEQDWYFLGVLPSAEARWPQSVRRSRRCEEEPGPCGDRTVRLMSTIKRENDKFGPSHIHHPSPFVLGMDVGTVLEEELNDADPVVAGSQVEGRRLWREQSLLTCADQRLLRCVMPSMAMGASGRLGPEALCYGRLCSVSCSWMEDMMQGQWSLWQIQRQKIHLLSILCLTCAWRQAI